MKRNKGSPKTEKGLILARLKYRSKRKGIPFDLSEDDIELPEFCPILGIKLDYNYYMGKGNRNSSATVDKIKPELGYTKGNVKIISARANRLKNDATLEEVKLILKYLEQNIR